MTTRTYLELKSISTFLERFRYLALKGNVGEATFGFDRYMNQRFYHSRQWNHVRQQVVARDLGCDLGVVGYEIHSRLYIHHMNPVLPANLREGDLSVFDPRFLITTTHATHNAIHYGDERQLPQPPTVRRPGDTKLW